MIHKKRSKSKRAAHLRVVPLPDARGLDRLVEVPRADSYGKPLEDWQVALWHLLNARNLFAAAFQRVREKDRTRAKRFNDACVIVTQVDAVVGERVIERIDGATSKRVEVDPRSLTKMAHHCEREFQLQVTKKRAEDWLWNRLPRTTSEAKAKFHDHPEADEFNKDGARNLAQAVLSMIASQGHDDSLKVLQRWRVVSPDEMLASSKYFEDVERVRAEVLDLWSQDEAAVGLLFNELLIQRSYRVLGLRRPLEARNRQRRRRDLTRK